ncbi:MAG: MarC family protein [Psychromonas sp.]|nr:MarC family protein [Psychromonas sp.]
MEAFFTLYLKLFFMMTPFFVLSVFLILSKNLNQAEKKSIIFKWANAVTIASLTFLLFGKYIFSIFGITLDAFKIGAGTVLFLSALDMIRSDAEMPETNTKKGADFAIVPLAIPSTVGPGMIGVLMVIGAQMSGVLNIVSVILSLLAAVISLVGVLLFSHKIQNLLGKQGLEILPKITGLFVSAIGAQIVFSGIKGFLFS